MVLMNPRTPLDLLIRHSRADGRPDTAYHPDLVGILALAADPDPRARLVAARSFRLPPEVRARLIDDADRAVALGAVCHVDASGDQVRAVVARFGVAAFEALAGHPNCPPDVLLAIATHPDCPVEAILDVAVHDLAPPAALAACLDHPHATAYVAANEEAPSDLLFELAGHTDPEVVLEVARNPRLTRAAGLRVLNRR
jgi:hypothetical protein